MIQLRSIPSSDRTQPVQIDHARGTIHGVSVIQIGAALGHQIDIDRVTLNQVAGAINSAPNGIKSRFTHGEFNSDSLGSHLGKVRNAIVDGNKVRADLVLLQSAKRSPKGDIYSYVLDLARDAPEDFGLSIAFEPLLVWSATNGNESPAQRDADGAWIRPAGAVNVRPLTRVKRLMAVDVVGDPAANRDGLFSSAGGDDAFLVELARLMQRFGIPAARALKLMAPPAPVAKSVAVSQSEALARINAVLAESPVASRPPVAVAADIATLARLGRLGRLAR